MFTGVFIYGMFIMAKVLDETYDVSGNVQREVSNLFNIIGETTKYESEKKKTIDAKSDNINIDNSKRKLYFAFGEDLDDYGDDDDDFLSHPTLDAEQQKQEEELKQILKKKKNRKNEQNKAIKRKSNAYGNNMKKERNKKIKQRHQLVGSQTGANENFKRKKLYTKEKLKKCTRGREKRHKSRTNGSD